MFAPQALDYITSVAMGSNQGFLLNLHTGITAACLVQLLSQPAAFTDFQWAYVQKLAHALCIRHTNPAKSVTAQLLAGQANPEDNISKLLLALLRLYRSSAGARGFDATAAAAAAEPAESAEGLDDSTLSEQRQDALVLVLQEWLGSLVQRFYGKQTPENNDRYYTSILTYVPIAAIFTNSSDKDSAEAGANRLAFDPLQQLSPLETADASTIAAGGPLRAASGLTGWTPSCKGC